MSSDACRCVEWVVAEARRKRPYLRLVPVKHLDRVVRHLYWHYRVDQRGNLAQHAREWLARRHSIPWWALALIKLALTIIVELIIVWTTGQKPSQRVV